MVLFSNLRKWCCILVIILHLGLSIYYYYVHYLLLCYYVSAIKVNTIYPFKCYILVAFRLYPYGILFICWWTWKLFPVLPLKNYSLWLSQLSVCMCVCVFKLFLSECFCLCHLEHVCNYQRYWGKAPLNLFSFTVNYQIILQTGFTNLFTLPISSVGHPTYCIFLLKLDTVEFFVLCPKCLIWYLIVIFIDIFLITSESLLYFILFF